MTQLLLNVPLNKEQTADAEYLTGIYSEMLNSGNFAPGTFVSGYIDYIELPGERLELADATFYADVEEGSTKMDYDLIDEGVVSITSDGKGTYTIEGIRISGRTSGRRRRWL